MSSDSVDEASTLRAVLERMRHSRARWQHSPGSVDVVFANVVDDWADEIEEKLSAALRTVQEGAPRVDQRLLAIAGFVNAYHNDATTLSAAESLKAIADVLGPPMQSTCTCRPLTREGVCVTCGKVVKA